MSNTIPSTNNREKVSRDLAQHIRGVAIRLKKSGIVMSLDAPNRHHNIIHAVSEWIGRPLLTSEHEQGFLSMTGKFLTREHAARLCGRDGKLYSEDLW